MNIFFGKMNEILSSKTDQSHQIQTQHITNKNKLAETTQKQKEQKLQPIKDSKYKANQLLRHK